MNILLVSSKYLPEYSGSGYRAHNLYKRLRVYNSGINVTVVAGSETENTTREYEFENFHISRIAQKRFPSLSENSLLRRFQLGVNFQSEYFKTLEVIANLHKEKNFDVIHIFGQNNVTIAAMQFGKIHNIFTLIELCNEMASPFPYIPFPFSLFIDNTFCMTRLENKRVKIICISERLRGVCIKAGIPEEFIWCRPNPVDERKFKFIPKKERIKIRKEKTKFSEKDILIVYIAKFIHRKNHIFLIDVIKRLPERYKLFLGGPLVDKGPLYKDNRELFDVIGKRIKEEELDFRVHLECGFYEDMEKYFQMADVFCFPTTAEGLGTPMLESIVCGTPVVANKIEGITDYWIKNGENGFVCVLDPDVFAENIRKAAEFPEEQRRKEAQKLINIAGTETIDKKYLELLKSGSRFAS